MSPPRLTLSYAVTRPYPASYAWVAYVGAAVLIVFLVVLNVALAGYETFSEFSSDPNITDHFWYDPFIPSFTRSGDSLCAVRLLALGDSLSTNYGLFRYTISGIDRPNAGDAGIAYDGWTLDDCDVTALYVNTVGQQLSSDYTAIVTCEASERKNASFTLRADWRASFLAGAYPTSVLGVKFANSTPADARGFVLGQLLSAAVDEATVAIIQMLNVTDFVSPEVLSFSASFPFCPASGVNADPACPDTDPPPLNITGTTLISGKGLIQRYAPDVPQLNSTPLLVLTNDTFGFAHIAANTVAALWAILRIDLGHASPNNFLLNPSIIPQAIFQSFPFSENLPGGESAVYSILVGDGKYGFAQSLRGVLPLESLSTAASYSQSIFTANLCDTGSQSIFTANCYSLAALLDRQAQTANPRLPSTARTPAVQSNRRRDGKHRLAVKNHRQRFGSQSFSTARPPTRSRLPQYIPTAGNIDSQ
ncbi:hypothetical protein MKEN_01317500 [Mycena kentingensis (nom. inval.)]|nr:hypothetical protein MKEN_01317500 [Mycena kentingensis (nom. inval.)]